MGRKSVKSKEKKLRRKEESVKYAASLVLVENANKQEDPMVTLLPFKKFDRNELTVNIECRKVTDLDEQTVDWAFNLTKINMEYLYEDSDWGWKDKDKRDEMADSRAWYIMARRTSDKQPMGFAHFRFDMDFDDEVLYCYEIQVEKEARRKGLGKFIMQILELLAFKSQMKKVMLTVFKKNEDAQHFFVKTLKYDVDETSPEGGIWEEYSYEILSKAILQRKPLSGNTQNTTTDAPTVTV